MPDRTSIRLWFTADRCTEALDGYDRFTTTWKWPIEEKVRLYGHAARAFRSDLPGPDRFQAFEQVYSSLRGYWQVFRNATHRMTAEEVFAKLDAEPAALSVKGLTLTDILRPTIPTAVMGCLVTVRNIKSVKIGLPVPMAISKFLHFYNPSLFPIYDSAVIENSVLRFFRYEWNRFSRRVDVMDLDFDLCSYLRYVVWLGDLMAEHRESIMAQFRSWLSSRRLQERVGHEGCALALSADALAAEVIAIGAWRCAEEGR